METTGIHPAFATQYAAVVAAQSVRRAEEIRRANAFRTDVEPRPVRRRRIRLHLPATFHLAPH